MEITITDGRTITISDRAALAVIAALERYERRKKAMKPDSVVKEQGTINSLTQQNEVVTR